MIRKLLVVALLTLTGVALDGTVAFAGTDFTQLCVAAGTSDGARVFISSASSTPLAVTGAGLDVGVWVFAGIAILIVGLALTIMPSRRSVPAVPQPPA